MILFYEKSSGIIFFRCGEDGVEYLFLYSGMVWNSDVVWEFFKGSMEIGEEEFEMVCCEFMEEMGIVVVMFLLDFWDWVEYMFCCCG